MNHKNLLILATLAILPIGASALPTSFFAPSSKIAKGNWVRIGIENTGVYELTYDQLREMGFSNPSAVSVYGRGGRRMAETFTDAAGNPLLDSDIIQVRVKHADNKIFFYGLGVEDIAFVNNSTLDLGGSFMKKDLNIYTNYGYYFLTDSTPVLSVESVSNTAGENAKALTQGAGYVYHEKDLYHNNTITGQLFWGESYFLNEPYNVWDVELPDLVGGQPGAMECAFYTLKNLNKGYTDPAKQIWLSYGVGKNHEEGTAAARYPIGNQDHTSDYIPQEPSLAQLIVPAGTDKVFVNYELGHYRSYDLSALDYWVFTYPKGIPTLRDTKGKRIGQDLIAFPSLSIGETGTFEISDPTSKSVWDVTDPKNPRELTISVSENKGIVTVECGAETPVIAIFDRMSTQKQISGFDKSWERIANQDIHALQAEGCDMAIITLPWLRNAAEELADVHRRVYGTKVVVVTAQELYNEFSGGVPDPMAYRSFVKMMYNSPGIQIKNVMLAGPISCDMRGINIPNDPEMSLIAFQNHETNLETKSMNANDFIGMMTDYFNVKTIEKQEMHVGVGILPLYYEEEFRRYIKKVEQFATDDSFAYRLNSNLNIGGIGDNHIHGQQAVDISAHMNEVNDMCSLNTTLAIDAYGYDQSLAKWFEAFNSGRHLATYFGHGASSYLGQNRLFFTPANIPQFKNKALPLMAFFGCTISDSDHGIRGLGEGMVFDTDYGLIAGLVATRSTWSGQNFDYAKQFFTSFHYSNPNSTTSSPVTAPQTLGEIFRKSKNASLFVNELAYQLLGDPGIIFPVVLQRVSVMTPGKVAPGETLKFTGSILKAGSSAVDIDFNGEIVLRVMEPEFSLVSEDLITKTNEAELNVRYGDQQISMSVARVVNGKFEMEVYIPLQMKEHEGRKMKFNFCAYNPATRTGASISKIAVVNSAAATTRPTPDVVPPVIEELVYEPMSNSIQLTASDDVALDLSRNMLVGGFQAFLDGQHLPEGSGSEPKLDNGPRRYTREFFLGNLQLGSHSMKVVVKDAAGNQAESEITFTITDNAGEYILATKEAGLSESITFYVDGNAPQTADIFITSQAGTELAKLPYRAGAEVIWDGNDSSGNRVAPGRYRAFLRETGSHQTKGHADVIIVPVL